MFSNKTAKAMMSQAISGQIPIDLPRAPALCVQGEPDGRFGWGPAHTEAMVIEVMSLML